MPAYVSHADDPIVSRFQISSNSRSRATERRKIEQDLRRAVETNGFELHYQPRLSLADGRIHGAEALLRWPHRKRGLLSPSAFIPVAEQSDLITNIGGWVIETACAEALNWPSTIVSLNVSARQLYDDALLLQLAHTIESTGLAPDRLEIELTESMLVEVTTDTLLTLSAIRDLGIGIALDDFGTGYASLSMLKRLPLTVMKIDRSLVREIPRNREDAAIVRAVVETGHALGLTVVAEGIETEDQRAFLSGVECDEGQGYFFCHPLTVKGIRALLCR